MNLTDSKAKLAVGGALCGVVAVLLAIFGNPGNMAICIACFIRDTAGALGMHQAAVVQYARPEIIGIVLGAFIMRTITKRKITEKPCTPPDNEEQTLLPQETSLWKTNGLETILKSSSAMK